MRSNTPSLIRGTLGVHDVSSRTSEQSLRVKKAVTHKGELIFQKSIPDEGWNTWERTLSHEKRDGKTARGVDHGLEKIFFGFWGDV